MKVCATASNRYGWLQAQIQLQITKWSKCILVRPECGVWGVA